jgi:hypothetical protein
VTSAGQSSTFAYQLPKKYLDSSYWVRGPKSKEGSESNRLIHLGVGHALSNWEHLEAAGALFFSTFVDSNSIAAMRAYGTIAGSRGREAALRQAGDTFFALRKNQYKKDRNIYEEIKAGERSAVQLIHNYGQACPTN